MGFSNKTKNSTQEHLKNAKDKKMSTRLALQTSDLASLPIQDRGNIIGIHSVK